eukprot:COSAG06_NODE_29171_length_561_cov_1.006494_2_plen_106_part_00
MACLLAHWLACFTCLLYVLADYWLAGFVGGTRRELEVTAESLITGSHTEGTLLEVFEHFAPFIYKNEMKRQKRNETTGNDRNEMKRQETTGTNPIEWKMKKKRLK